MINSRHSEPSGDGGAVSRRGLHTAEGSHPGAFRPLDWGLLAVPAVIWSLSFLFISVGLDSFTPVQVAALRIGFGLAVLWCFPAARIPIETSDRAAIALLAVCWLAVPLTLFPIAEQWIDTSVAGMLNAGMPVFTALVSAVMLGRFPGPAQMWGLGVGLVGVVCIGLPTARAGGPHQALGVLLCVIAVACYGLASNLNVPLVQKYGSLTVIARAQQLALVLTGVPALMQFREARPLARPVLALVALGALGTGAAYAMAGSLLARVGATRGSMITYAMPPLAILWGVWLRSERVSPAAIGGTGLVLAGAWLASRRDTRAPASIGPLSEKAVRG